jgi:hypothetical protein
LIAHIANSVTATGPTTKIFFSRFIIVYSQAHNFP